MSRPHCLGCGRFLPAPTDQLQNMRPEELEERQYQRETFVGDTCACDQGISFNVLNREPSPFERLSVQALAASKRPGPTPGAQRSRMHRYVCQGCTPARIIRAAGREDEFIHGPCGTVMVALATGSEQPLREASYTG